MWNLLPWNNWTGSQRWRHQLARRLVKDGRIERRDESGSAASAATYVEVGMKRGRGRRGRDKDDVTTASAATRTRGQEGNVESVQA